MFFVFLGVDSSLFGFELVEEFVCNCLVEESVCYLVEPFSICRDSYRVKVLGCCCVGIEVEYLVCAWIWNHVGIECCVGR